MRVSALLFCFCVLCPLGSIAADTPKDSVAREDAEAVRKSAEELGKLFGVETQREAPAKKADAAAQPRVTVAEVMDKAVDRISDVVGAMAETIKKIAPDIWRIMIKQQYAKAIGNILPWLGLATILWIVSRSFKKWRLRINAEENALKEDEREEYRKNHSTEYEWACGLYYVSLIFTAFAAFMTTLDLRTSIQLFINPEFYAIQDLLRMILTRGRGM